MANSGRCRKKCHLTLFFSTMGRRSANHKPIVALYFIYSNGIAEKYPLDEQGKLLSNKNNSLSLPIPDINMFSFSPPLKLSKLTPATSENEETSPDVFTSFTQAMEKENAKNEVEAYDSLFNLMKPIDVDDFTTILNERKHTQFVLDFHIPSAIP